MWRSSSPELLATSLLLLMSGPSVIPSANFVSAEAVLMKCRTTSSSLMADTLGWEGKRPWRKRNIKNRRENYFLSNLELSGDPGRNLLEITGYECVTEIGLILSHLSRAETASPDLNAREQRQLLTGNTDWKDPTNNWFLFWNILKF